MKLPARMEKFLNDIAYPVNPNFKIKNKAHDSGLHAFLTFFGKLFNPELNTRYITVLLGECWFPADYFDENGDFREDRAESAV